MGAPIERKPCFSERLLDDALLLAGDLGGFGSSKNKKTKEACCSELLIKATWESGPGVTSNPWGSATLMSIEGSVKL